MWCVRGENPRKSSRMLKGYAHPLPPTSAKARVCNSKSQWGRLHKLRTALDAPIVACADERVAQDGNIEALGGSSGRGSAWRYGWLFVGEAGACV